MSDPYVPTRWWVDTENATVVAVECNNPNVDPAGRRITAATHFETERGAWDALATQVTERVIATGCAVAAAEQALANAIHQSWAVVTQAEASLRDWQCLAATAARNFALYQGRRQEWNRQVDQALRALEPAPAPPPTFQRGDVVDVTLGNFTYRGLVTATRRGKLYIRTRSSGDWFDPRRTAITLIERRGKKDNATLCAMAREFV